MLFVSYNSNLETVPCVYLGEATDTIYSSDLLKDSRFKRFYHHIWITDSNNIPVDIKDASDSPF